MSGDLDVVFDVYRDCRRGPKAVLDTVIVQGGKLFDDVKVDKEGKKQKLEHLEVASLEALFGVGFQRSRIRCLFPLVSKTQHEPLERDIHIPEASPVRLCEHSTAGGREGS